MKILLLNGPNMNMLGKRNPSLYGTQTLKDLQKSFCAHARRLGVKAVCRHSNSEGQIINILQRTRADAIVLNAAAYSHYSVAIRDCVECLHKPVVEVHMTDVTAREDFRKVDLLSEVCEKTFLGNGFDSYVDALEYLVK